MKADGKAEAEAAKPAAPSRTSEPSSPTKAGASAPAAPAPETKRELAAPVAKPPASPAPPSSARKGERYTLKALVDLKPNASSLESDRLCMQELRKLLEESSELDPEKEMPARQAESGPRGGGGQRNAGAGGASSGAGTPRKGGGRGKNDAPLRDRNGKIIEVKALEMSENRWKPSKPTDDEEKVFKAAKGILNKLTLEKFDKLYGELLNVGITTASLMRGLVVLIYDKAVLEPHFINMYAKMCQRLAKDLPEFSDESGVLPFGEVLIGK